MDEWQAMAQDAYAHTIPLKPGAQALLDKLRREGHPMALLTAGLSALAMAAVERHGLETYLQGFFFAQEAGLETEYILCSGDPDSLDAVILPGIPAAIVDGTAPQGIVS